jgi:peptidoglycan hydrolase-like protein with peptidoglycan-binding domain
MGYQQMTIAQLQHYLSALLGQQGQVLGVQQGQTETQTQTQNGTQNGTQTQTETTGQTTAPVLIADGVFGEQTRNAVQRIQSLFGLPQTGEVNEDLWNRIRSAYQQQFGALGSEPVAVMGFRRGETLRHGDENLTAELLRTMLHGISHTFENITHVSFGYKYDEDTEKAVREIQTLSGIPATGIVDVPTWNAIASLYNSINES